MVYSGWNDEGVRGLNRLTGVVLASVALLAVSVALAGCDGDGNVFSSTAKLAEPAVPDSSGGTQTTPSDSGSTTPPPSGGSSGGGTTMSDKRFEGTWIASFGDDFASGVLENEYAARLDLQRAAFSRITGTGKFFRFFRQGQNLWDESDVTVTQGSTADDYAQIVVNSRAFDYPQTWYLRLSGGLLSGMYTAFDGHNNVMRAGHAQWRLLSDYSIAGDWVSGFGDSFSVNDPQVEDSGPMRHRTAGITLNARTSQIFAGKGDFVELREQDRSVGWGFSVNDGSVVGPEATFTFDQFYAPTVPSSVTSAPMYWKGFYSTDHMVGAFGQFNASGEFTRFGHASWYHVPANLQPSAVNGTWVSAFQDALTAEAEPGIFLALMTLEVRNGGGVTGSNVQIRQETGQDADYQRYPAADGQMEALALHLELGSQVQRIVWDLYPAGGVLVGSYQRFNNLGDFLGRGVAEWWPQLANTTLDGSWAASYADTTRVGGAAPEQTGLGYVTLAGQTMPDISGTGSLLLAGERTPKSFNVSGTVSNSEVQWRWAGRGLSGNTIWRLRQSGTMLVGTYTNYNNIGDVESRGCASWLRTSAK